MKIWMPLASIVLSGLPTAICAQTEIAPHSQHGTLRVLRAEDSYLHPDGKIRGGFYGITGVPLDGQFYFYVGSGATQGAGVGPGAECPWEDTLTFRVPYTHWGMRGSAGTTYLGSATPCLASDPPGNLDGFNMPGGALLYSRALDGTPGRVILTSQHTKTGSDFRKILFGISADGVSFDWKVMYQVAPSAPFNSLAPHLQPDPADPDRLFGLVPIGSGGSFSAICIEVVFNGGSTRDAVVRFATNASCTQWQTIPFGGTLSQQPAVMVGGQGFRARGLQKLDGAFQAWGFRWQLPEPANTPCTAGSLPYANNVQVPGNSTTLVHRIEMIRLTPSFQASPATPLGSQTRDLPPAYLGGFYFPFAVEDRQGVTLLYTASQDWFICDIPFGGGQGTKGDIVLSVLDENF